MYRLIRELLFRLDAESAHEFAVEQMLRLQQIPIVLRAITSLCETRNPVTLLGMTFPNRIGIAAGFDKNAVMMPFLAALGFGFIEVGTVTLHPQPGNPKPRMFRYPRYQAIINRMGFNNEGADAVAARLRAWDRRVPTFVNIGKNRDVPLEGAPDAYAACAEKLAPHADAVVVNLSSPNTPSLRELQRPEHLERILDAVGPALVKIAPDVDDAMLGEICDVCVRRARGMICTNTTVDRPFSTSEAGGLSGEPLMEKSTNVLAAVRKRAGPEFPLIGVGGVFTPGDVRAKREAGADLVQIYTSFIYEGPSLPRRLARA
ncbi:MAG TPA: quinone-dependent dihydroorotate dehydrogenase [Thermoanaerobaculia bacterium]|nr:quinone-dependent dihydroorotate dehydrogenase [Thermoanaerobaculia bacterium]